MDAVRTSLRTTTARITVLFVVVSACVAGVLVWTAHLARTTTQVALTSVENVRIAEEAEIDLLLLQRATDPIIRRSIEAELRSYLAQAHDYVTSPAEAEALEQAERHVGELVDAAALGDRDLGDEREAAYQALEDLVNVNVAHAREVATRAESLATLASALGASATALLLIASAGVLVWLRHRAFAPLFALAAEMNRLGQGDLSARVAEDGVGEIGALARGFNSMAATIQRQREAQMTFVAGIAHDLRTPLTALKMSSSIAAPGRPLPPEERLREVFARIARQIERMETMVTDLVDVAQIEAGHLQLHVEPCDVRDLARTTLDLFAPTAPSHDLVLEAPTSPVRVECDPQRIEQVLDNLVSNAIKYSPGGGAVRVRVARKGDEIVISVSDEGLGIPQSELGRVFDSFHRAGAPKKIAGRGLGLFVARRIVEAHGGTIGVQSTSGEGSTFTVRLPAKTPIAATATSAEPIPVPA